jgi:AraC family transcriptional regulator
MSLYPDATPPQEFRFNICGEVAADVTPNRQGVVNKIILGGRFAVARHFGSNENHIRICSSMR